MFLPIISRIRHCLVLSAFREVGWIQLKETKQIEIRSYLLLSEAMLGSSALQ